MSATGGPISLPTLHRFAFGTAFKICYDDASLSIEGEPSFNDRKIGADVFCELVSEAVRLGCRHFDCAPLYKTQTLVGEMLAKEGSIQRNRGQFFITSKVPPNMMQPDKVERSLRSSLAELQLSRLDLFLIHAPFSTKHTGDDDEIFPVDPATNQLKLDETEHLLETTWQKMVQLKEAGLTRFIGISNVNEEQVKRLHAIHRVDVVQNEFHLYNQNRVSLLCNSLGIHFEGFAAFGCPPKALQRRLGPTLRDPAVLRIASSLGLKPPQVLIHWLAQRPNMSFVIRSDNVEQLRENWHAANGSTCPLSAEQLVELDSANRNERVFIYKDIYKAIGEHHEYPFKGDDNGK